MEERNDERLNYPERWRFNGREVLWIVDSGMGECSTHVTYRGSDDCVHNACTRRDGDWLTYTAPDPWEGVTLPTITIARSKNANVGITWSSSFPHEYSALPSRTFKLVPL